MATSHSATKSPQDASLFWIASEVSTTPLTPPKATAKVRFAPLQPIRQWLDNLEISDREMAQALASIIPAQCPFERTIKLFGRPVLHIPPMCKLNPFYEEVVGLRFRALCYLADVCGEDISPYC